MFLLVAHVLGAHHHNLLYRDMSVKEYVWQSSKNELRFEDGSRFKMTHSNDKLL